MTRRVRLAVLAAACATAVALLTPWASAHALVRTSNPADGALLHQAPSQVVITFTEPPDPGLSSIQVLDSNGASVTSGTSHVVDAKPLVMEVPLESIGKGVYTVTWRTVSKSDGHTTGGSFSFGVGVKPGATTPKTTVESSTPSALSVVGRSLFYTGLFVLLAGAVLTFAAMAGRPPAARMVLPLASAAALIGVGLMFVAEHSSTGASWWVLLRSSAGRAIWEQGVGVLAAGVAAIVVVVKPGKLALAALGVTTAVAMLLHANSSHAGATQSLAWFNVAVQWLHIVAVSIWIGGLLWLLVAVPALPEEQRAAAVKRFSFVFAITLGVIFATGMLRLTQEMGSWSAWAHILSTGFGTAAFIKLSLFLVLLALAALNRYRNVPAFTANVRTRALTRVVAVEAVIGIAVLGVTAVLSQLAPPNDISQQSRATAAQQIVVSGSDFGTTTKVRLTIAPGTVGPNSFSADVVDYDTGRPVRASGVSLNFSLPDKPQLNSTLELRHTSGATWTGKSTVLALNGTWNIDVVIQGATEGTDVPLKVTPRRPPEDIQVAKQAGQPTIYTIDIGNGASVQAYVDPGRAGTNNVHWTFFDSGGKELPIGKATSTITDPSGKSTRAKLLRFSEGHFASNVTLTAGKWTFQIDATTKDGDPVSVYFSHDIAS